MLLEQFLFLYEKIVTDQIDQIDFTKFDASQFLLSQNQRDDKNLLEKLQIYEPNFSSKNEQFHSSIEKANWLNLELVKIYKKYSEPYKLSYHSVNVPSIDLEKVYKIRSYAISLNSNWNESSFVNNSISPMEMEDSDFVRNLLKISGGELGKPSSPVGKAKGRLAMTNRAKGGQSKPGGGIFAEAWLQNPSKRSRPAAANRLAQQLQPGQAKDENGLFGKFSSRPTPDPRNPGCSGGPRSVTVLSSQQSQSEYQPDGYLEEQVKVDVDKLAKPDLPLDAKQKLLEDPKLLELSIDPRNGQIDKQSFDEAESVMQTQRETELFDDVRRPNREKGERDIDFIVSGPLYDEVDIKTPTSFFTSQNGLKKPIPQDLLDSLAYTSGGKSIDQKKGSERCLHILDLKDLLPHQKERYQTKYMEGSRGRDPVLAEHIQIQNNSNIS